MRAMRALALLLVVAVPSVTLAQQKVSLDDLRDDQPISQRLLIDDAFNQPPLAESQAPHAWVWWTVGASSVAVALALGIAAFVLSSQHAPERLTPGDFGCSPTCSGWVNKPAQ
jgi:hypothetical protein